MSSNQQSEEQSETQPKADGDELEIVKGADQAMQLIKHKDADSKINEMLGSLAQIAGDRMDESEKELYERSRGLIHRDARVWFVPAILFLIVLIGVVCWGILGRSSKHDELFDKIVSSQDRFVTVKTLRDAEQHEIYSSLFVIIFGLIFVGLGAAGWMANRAYTLSDARKVGASGKNVALLNQVQMIKIRQDQEDKTQLKEEVKSKEKEIVVSEERRRETQEKLNENEKELELKTQQCEEEKRMHMLREKMLDDKVTQLTSDKESLKDNLHHEQKLHAMAESELRSQRERSKTEENNLHQRLLTAPRDKLDAKKANESGCVCM